MTNNSLLPEIGHAKLTARFRQAIVLMTVIFVGIIISLVA